MAIDLSALDKLTQKFTKDPVDGKWYARTYSGSTLLVEDELLGFSGGPVPNELQDVFAAQRIAVCRGGTSLMATQVNEPTGRVKNSVNGEVALQPSEVVRGNRCVIFGSSTTDQNADATNRYWKMSRGYFNWLNAFLGNRLHLVYNAGVAGNTLWQMDARIDTDVFAYEPSWVIFQGFGNDLYSNSISAIDTFTKAVSMFEKIKARGINLAVLVPTNRNAADASVTAAKRAEHYKFCHMLRQYARETPGIILIDAANQIVDHTSLTGDAPANMLQDTTHLSSRGAQLVGYEGARMLDKYVPYQPWHIGSKAETYGQSSGMPCLFDNPTFIGTNPSGNGTGSSGTVAFGCTVSRQNGAGLTIVNSIVNTANIPYPTNSLIPPCKIGFAQKMVMTATAANERGGITIPVTGSRIALTDILQGRVGVVVRNAVNLRTLYLWVALDSTTIADLYRQSPTTQNTTDQPFAITDFHVELATVQQLVSAIEPDGVATCSINVSAIFDGAGSADVYVYQPQLNRIF